jgi:hypothetical protein
MPAKKRSTSKDAAPALETSHATPADPTSTKPGKPTRSPKAETAAKSAPRDKPAKPVTAAAAPKSTPKKATSKTTKVTSTPKAPVETAAPVEATAPLAVDSPTDPAASGVADAPAHHAAPTFTVDDVRRTAFLLSQRRQGPADPVADWFEAERLLQRAS